MDIGKLGIKKHHIKALIEIDVTESRKKIRKIRQESGEKVSFNAWILKCISHAVNKHKDVHSVKKGKNGLVIFDEIDITLIVEKKLEGTLVPLPLVIRNVCSKTIFEIYNEIENAKQQDIADTKKYILGNNKNSKPVILFSLFPQFIRLIIWKILLRNPMRIKNMMGTVGITAVGMMGKVHGWFIPFSIHPLSFALGSIVCKPGVVKQNIEIREFLEMTVLIDHDVVDGAPAARFVSYLVDLIEQVYGL
jgi:pyruvate/2-oxoglutarate dehydrogenase complex dihydrolipoamide acyltransferase (E2) component